MKKLPVTLAPWIMAALPFLAAPALSSIREPGKPQIKEAYYAMISANYFAPITEASIEGHHNFSSLIGDQEKVKLLHILSRARKTDRPFDSTQVRLKLVFDNGDVWLVALDLTVRKGKEVYQLDPEYRREIRLALMDSVPSDMVRSYSSPDR